MSIIIFFLFSILSLLIGTAAIYMAMNEEFPLEWLYYHYFLRKPLCILILFGQLIASHFLFWKYGFFPEWLYGSLLFSTLGLILAYRMHQEIVFKAVDDPEFTSDYSKLPLKEDMEVAIVQCDGVTKGFPLDCVVHHHIINDKFNSKMVSLTYCAMCRSIIPFDVTNIGPLFVASFKNANMIVADRKTKTFFQQATFKSEIGPLHPHTLKMLSFQILTWKDVKKLNPAPPVVKVTQKDLEEFELPIPGVWKMLLASERTPGLSAKRKDKAFPARTRVIGIYEMEGSSEFTYLKNEVLNKKVVKNKESGFFLVGHSGVVNGFLSSAKGKPLEISLCDDKIVDLTSKTKWDLRGHFISGPLEVDLAPIRFSDEYWFSWRKYHPQAEVIRV